MFTKELFSSMRFFWFFILLIAVVFSNCSKMQSKVSFYGMPCGGEGKKSCDFPENGPEGVYVDASMEDVAHPEKTSLDVLIILENSKSMEKFSHIVAPQLTQFVKCVEPLNWKVGILSSMWKKKGERNNNGGGAYSSFLMPMEKQGQISNKVWINSGTYDYQKIFFDTVSLNSGCSLPPYCIKRKE